MASPFRVFRRHQKVMIAVLCGMAMVAFVFAPLLLDMFGERRAKDPVAVRTARFGDITESQLGYMINTRHALRNFIETVARRAAMAGGQPRGQLVAAVFSDISSRHRGIGRGQLAAVPRG